MRQFLISFLFIFIVSPFMLAQKTIISDFNFENYLETHSADGAIVVLGNINSMGDGLPNNNRVFTNRITDVINLDVSNLNINNLIGIESFLSLEVLICSNNNLTNLNISNNTKLKSLLCSSNAIPILQLGNNFDLETLNCSNNQLKNIDLNLNVALKNLSCSGNQITQLNIDSNVNLTSLNVSNNQIADDLVVLLNTNLENLFCASNQIKTLNLSNNNILKNLDASNNLISTLNLNSINTFVCPDPQTDPATICQDMATINVARNQLASLILNNGFNNLISALDTSENPDLYCIQIDTDFLPPTNWLKDDWTYYSDTTCLDIYTYVPDDNFEDYLETNGWGDDIANNNFVLTTRIENQITLNITNKNIDELTGIEDFTALQNLNCSVNGLTEIDLSNNINLLDFNCSNNVLQALNLNSNILLTTLDCSFQTPYVDVKDASNNYVFDTLNLEANITLESVNCSNNNINNLDLVANNLLNNLDCSSNQIQTLNVTSNTDLISLICNNNSILALNLKNGKNDLITTFNATNNPDLFCVEVDDVMLSESYTGWLIDDTNGYSLSCGVYVPDDAFENYLENNGLGDGVVNNNFVSTTLINTFVGPLNISNLGISDLTGIEGFIVLEELDCSSNTITSLNLDNNIALTKLNCSANQIENLDLSLNLALTELLTNDNVLLNLNIKNGNNNLLTIFNAIKNPNLYCINVDNAIIGGIPASWQKDDFASYNGDCNGGRYTSIPDDLFEQALIDIGYDDVIDTLVLTSNIEHVLSLDVSDKNIEDLTGIRDFKSLKELDCSGNFLASLDMNGMINLEELNCNSNYLLTNNIADPNGLLNLNGTDSLIKLFCASNNISELNMSLNVNLETLDCADNNLDILDVSANMLLKTLNCSNNNLADIDISDNDIIEDLNCNSNQINTLTTSVIINTTLKKLSCANNNIPTLIVDVYQVLTDLNCKSNALSELNTASNTDLKTLDFTNNQITEINLLSNSNLMSVLASQNELMQLSFAANTPLETLNCSNNQIIDLQVNITPLIKRLFCSNNQITDLDLSNNGDLVELNTSSNLISNLILPANLSALKTFNCSRNELSGDIDLTTMGTTPCPEQFNPDDFCPDSITINVSNNQLDFVNIQNGINTDISSLNTTNNPELSCIQVDDINNIKISWVKDATTQYSLDCRFGETFVPDDAFEEALISLGYDIGVLDDYVPTVNINTLTVLDISGKNISDLTGIEDFEALQNLNCSNNTLSAIDLSKNINLTEINCSSNSFSDIDFSSNIALTTINSSNNILTSLDVIANVNIENLNIANNLFTKFSPINISRLSVFNCDSNQLVELDFTANASLTSLSCQSNALEVLNIKNGQNPSLTDLNAKKNINLVCIETDTGAAPGGATWLKDVTAQYVINCYYGQTNVPDDAFETALIALGYDSGPLDDYVLTVNIETISFLDISNKGITNLTGIEGFVNLTNLNVSENTIVDVDLKANTRLQNLNASSNLLSAIDLSFSPNLMLVDVSNNVLTELNLESNLSLIDLNVANNTLTVLNVDFLVNLEILDCSSNQLDALSVTLNPNLKELYCQANLFIQDKLNIQNGANLNLEIFSAINNPDLKCILVDDPFVVISNTSGIYDEWYKDATASYQTICADADNDGIANADDQCPNTPFGSDIDLFGCRTLSLPNNNFTIQITSETCLNNNNGKINIVTLEYFNYTATLIRDGFNQTYRFTNDIDMLNLLAGTYQMCITVKEWPNYLSCYDIVISQPEPLTVVTNRSADGKKVSIKMSGSSSYNINFNELEFSTTDSNLTLNLQEGVNAIKISTDAECQGVHEERILVSDEVFIYPNPFQDEINMYLGNNDTKKVMVNIYSYLGQLVNSKVLNDQKSGKISVNTTNLALGVYTISIQTNTSISTFKIVKK